MNVQTLEQRIRRLEDIEAVKQIVARYAMGGDTRNDPAIMGGCFTRNAVGVYQGFGVVRGRDAITKFIHDAAREKIFWTIHYMTTPVINFNPDGNTGTVFFYLWELGRTRESSDKPTESTWIAGLEIIRLQIMRGLIWIPIIPIRRFRPNDSGLG